MKLSSEQLEFYIQKAKQLFVWVQISEDLGLYIKATKVSFREYLSSLENSFDTDIYLEFGDDGELYLGRKPEE